MEGVAKAEAPRNVGDAVPAKGQKRARLVQAAVQEILARRRSDGRFEKPGEMLGGEPLAWVRLYPIIGIAQFGEDRESVGLHRRMRRIAFGKQAHPAHEGVGQREKGRITLTRIAGFSGEVPPAREEQRRESGEGFALRILHAGEAVGPVVVELHPQALVGPGSAFLVIDARRNENGRARFEGVRPALKHGFAATGEIKHQLPAGMAVKGGGPSGKGFSEDDDTRHGRHDFRTFFHSHERALRIRLKGNGGTMRYSFACLAFCCILPCIPLDAAALFPGNPTEIWARSGEGMGWVDLKGESHPKALRVVVPKKTEKPWEVQVEARAPGAVVAGLVEIRFSLRALSAENPEGLCSVSIKMLTRPENEGIGRWTVKAGREWKPFVIQCPLTHAFPSENLALALMFGEIAQSLEIADLAVAHYTEAEAGRLLEEERRRQLAAVKLRPRIDELPPTATGQKWVKTFGDEFDGKALDETRWVVREGKRHDAMRSARAVALDGQGALRMSIFQEGEAFLNSWVDTEGKFEQTYGFFSARMKMQKSTGHWCAFWLQTPTTGRVDGSGKDGTEIDIMEKPWLNDEVNHALHWDGYGKDHQVSATRSVTPGIMEGWHTYSLLWTPTNYVFYIDDGEVWRSSAGGVCQVPAHLRLTDEAEMKDSSWAGNVKKAKLPDAWLVDYVRVYALLDASGNPVHPAGATAKPAGAAAAAMSTDGNLLRNGGFESTGAWALNNWAKNDVAVEVDTENPHGGAMAQRITVRSIAGASPVTEFIQELPIRAGQKAMLSFWARGDAPALKVELRQNQPPFASLYALPVALGGAWKEYTASFTVPATQGPCRMTFRIEGVGSVWLDDVRMTAD